MQKVGFVLLTHATNSATPKVVGAFAPAGIHIDQNE